MTLIRCLTACAAAAALALTAAPAVATTASAGWEYVGSYTNLADCRADGQYIVRTHPRADHYSCGPKNPFGYALAVYYTAD